MKIKLRGLSYDYVLSQGQSKTTWLLLHGFTGTKNTFRQILPVLEEDTVLTLDLLGHGNTTSQADFSRYAIEEQCKDLADLLDQLEVPKVSLLGYSLGGRLALAFTLYYPERVEKLVLESSSPGLKTQEEQQLRQIQDQALADKVMEKGLVSFVNDWENLALFSSQKKLPLATQEAIRKERLSQDVEGLQKSLLGMGTGSQPSYWNQLSTISCPVFLFVGALDTKFCQLAAQINPHLKKGFIVTFSEVGHAVHLEAPAEFSVALKNLDNRR